jgi:pimeloyl-ACP methyl ester carboxylesterase
MAGHPIPHLSGVEHRTVRVRGLEMHVAEAGEGEPLVLLHGWPQHWYMWRRLIPGLAERYRVIAPDLPGLGWSEAPSSGYEKETLGGDVLALLDALGLERVRLAGHDWGGFIGFLLCLYHPERVERFLALNITHPWSRLGARALPRFWYMAVLASPVLGPAVLRRAPGFVKRVLTGGGGHGEGFTEAEHDAFAEVLRRPEGARASQGYYRSFLLKEILPIMRGRYRDERLEVPTLLLFGEEDFAIPAEALEGYESHAEDMRVELVPGVGHFIAEQAPELVLERTLSFFAEVPAPAGA